MRTRRKAESIDKRLINKYLNKAPANDEPQQRTTNNEQEGVGRVNGKRKYKDGTCDLDEDDGEELPPKKPRFE